MGAKSKFLWFLSLPALLLFLLGLTPTLAKPKYVATGRCLCICDIPGDATLGIYDTMGATCDVFNGKTCNRNDPNTGGVRSGTLVGCEVEMKPEAATPKIPPTKVEPKIMPSGAETPGTESPNVQPKGGIQRYRALTTP